MRPERLRGRAGFRRARRHPRHRAARRPGSRSRRADHTDVGPGGVVVLQLDQVEMLPGAGRCRRVHGLDVLPVGAVHIGGRGAGRRHEVAANRGDPQRAGALGLEETVERRWGTSRPGPAPARRTPTAERGSPWPRTSSSTVYDACSTPRFMSSRSVVQLLSLAPRDVGGTGKVQGLWNQLVDLDPQVAATRRSLPTLPPRCR